MKPYMLIMAIGAAGLFSPVSVHGEEELSLVVEKVTGSTRAFSLETLDKLTFTSTDMQVFVGGQTPVLFTIDEIQKITFDLADPTGLEPVAVPVEEVQVCYLPAENTLHISSPAVSSLVGVANMQGVVLLQHTPSEKSFNLRLPDMPSGVYIVYVKSESGLYTTKFVKR